jgi:predicted unusual protein kinase regulating ubiquinone biosynthesis (AarF/ABC1/UbiB family)
MTARPLSSETPPQRSAPRLVPRVTAAARLTRLREALGLTQRQLATEFGVTRAAIGHWESGTRPIPGPVEKLIGLYEDEERVPRPSAEGWEPSMNRLTRGAQALNAFVIGAGLYRVFGNLESTTIAKRVRIAAIKRYSKALGELRGLTMKLGQTVDYLTFFMPEDERKLFFAALKELEPMSAANVADVMVSEFGRTPRQLFATWDPTPIAMASLGQVHKATLVDGRTVAVKVQYPRMAQALAFDLESIDVLDRLYSTVFRGQKPGVLHHELRERMLEECDYRIEAASQREFRALFAGNPNVVVPEVIDELSGRRVLTTVFAPGLSFDEFNATASSEARNRAGDTLWKFFTESLLVHGVFQTDPHPGNLLFDEDRVVFLDFGRIKRLSPEYRPINARVLRAAMERDLAIFSSEILRSGAISEPARFDVAYAYKMIVASFLPWLVEGEFQFTVDFVKQAARVYLISNPIMPVLHMTSDLPFLHLMVFGVHAILARLGARVDCSTPVRKWLFEPGIDQPPPFGLNELRSLGLEMPR